VSPDPVLLAARARRVLVRPSVRRLCVAVLAVATLLTVASFVSAAGAARDRWGRTRPVVVATRDLVPGDVVGADAVEVRDLPEAVLGDAPVAEAPLGAVVRQPILAGEPVVAARLAPHGLTGAAALVPPGHRAVAVPVGPTGAPPVALGDLVDVLAVLPPGVGLAGAQGSGDLGDADDDPAVRLVDRATVVAVGADAVTVAVPEPDATRVAWAVGNAAVVLTLAGA
jgi:Flp pilus assembly protein CpaB